MIYRPLVKGSFIKRLNRFIAEVQVNGTIEEVHVKNTGRCRELFIQGSPVFLEPSDNPNRKTKYSLVSIYKGDHLINIDSQVPNLVVYESLLAGEINEIQGVTFAKREVTYGGSRFDIYYETETSRGFIEVKGVTLEENGLAMFPDAPTIRGARHITELIEGVENGYRNYICFLIQMDYVDDFRPHHERDMLLSDKVYEGLDKGLGVLIYNCSVTEEGISLKNKCSLMSKQY